MTARLQGMWRLPQVSWLPLAGIACVAVCVSRGDTPAAHAGVQLATVGPRARLSGA